MGAFDQFRGLGNFHGFFVQLVGVIGKPFFVPARVAAVAIGVGLRVADLTLHLADMDIVVPYFTALQIPVTIRTFGRLF